MIGNTPDERPFPWRLAVIVACVALPVGLASGVLVAMNEQPQPQSQPQAQVRSSGAPSSSCVPARYKTAAGPESCEPLEVVCAPGAPWFVADLERRCGEPKVARISVYNTDLVPAGECLMLVSGDWADATAMMVGMNAPMASCNANVDMTEVEANGLPLTECVQVYPYTRQTFLAVLDTPTGEMTACISANNGA